jgi:hypothetical protein
MNANQALLSFAQVIGMGDCSNFLVSIASNEAGLLTRRSKPFADSSRYKGQSLPYMSCTLTEVPETQTFMIKGKPVIMQKVGKLRGVIVINLWKDFNKEAYFAMIDNIGQEDGITVSPNGDVSVDLAKHPTAPVSGFTSMSFFIRGNQYTLPLPKGCEYTDADGREWNSVRVFVDEKQNKSAASIWAAFKAELETVGADVDKVAAHYGLAGTADTNAGDLSTADALPEPVKELAAEPAV